MSQNLEELARNYLLMSYIAKNKIINDCDWLINVCTVCLKIRICNSTWTNLYSNTIKCDSCGLRFCTTNEHGDWCAECGDTICCQNLCNNCINRDFKGQCPICNEKITSEDDCT